jgi:hypothetical protein
MGETSNAGDILFSKTLIERAKKERETLMRQIEESQTTIERSREILARLDEVLRRSGRG